MAAFDPATLDRWRALAIIDRDGTTVGTVQEFYLDRETGHPTWALVHTGLFGAGQTFVPLVHATEIDDGLQVPYEKSHIKDAPQLDPHDELTPDEEARLFAHYGVEYHPSPTPDPGTGPVTGGSAWAGRPDPGSSEAPGPVVADPGSLDALGPDTEAPRSGDTSGSGRTGSAVAVAGERGDGESTGTTASPDEPTRGVPAEPGTADPDQIERPGTVRDKSDRSMSGRASSASELHHETTDPDPDLSRPAPVEPAAAQPEEHSPLERAKRRIERLVGGGQDPNDPEANTGDRDTAEGTRLTPEEDDPRRR